MAFTVRAFTRPDIRHNDPTLYELAGAGCRATVWPAVGFNCINWNVAWQGRTVDLLYADPALFDNGRPTRSGIPVLFPFPNRIRAGQFRWDGRGYQLPLNDPDQRNAIHGFAVRHAWRVVEEEADGNQAWLTGEFQCSMDAPECLEFWPADHRIRLTYRLAAGSLRLEAEVANPDRKRLPFGLGYHPYFRMPFVAGEFAENCTVQVLARQYWQLVENLPTGRRVPVDAQRDLNSPRPFAGLLVDDVLTDLPGHPPAGGPMLACAAVTSPPGETLQVHCSGEFRELVVFTPPHRQAFCVEPYTCTTDAINLQAQGVDAGLLVLDPGQTWSAVVELRFPAAGAVVGSDSSLHSLAERALP
jgi:aldose 1-epimerase